jgi:hypothetical protein
LEDPNYENIEVATLRRLASAFDVALTVRFIPFSELARWTDTLSEEKLIVPKFDEESPCGTIPDEPSASDSGASRERRLETIKPRVLVSVSGAKRKSGRLKTGRGDASPC